MMGRAPLIATALSLAAAADAFTPQRYVAAPRTYARSDHAATRGACSLQPRATAARGGGALSALSAATRDELIGEATGTAILLAFGYGAVATKEMAGSLSLSGLAAVWGFGVALGAAVSSDLSGGHMRVAARK